MYVSVCHMCVYLQMHSVCYVIPWKVFWNIICESWGTPEFRWCQVWWTAWTVESESSGSLTCIFWLFLELVFYTVPYGAVTVADWRIKQEKIFSLKGLTEISFLSRVSKPQEKKKKTLIFHGLINTTDRFKKKNGSHHVIV